MAYSHIAHLCHLGNGVIMANYAGLAGHVVVEDQAVIGGLCGVHQFVRIGRLCMIGGLTKVTQDCRRSCSWTETRPASGTQHCRSATARGRR